MSGSLPLFSARGLEAVELAAGDVGALQAFFEANPLYFETVLGAPPGPGEAAEEFASRPPEGWPYTRRWLMAFVDDSRSIVGVSEVVSDLLATGVWHVGLFVVETRRHGSGDAQALYAALEAWMRSQGAAYLRLGVVTGNPRAGRFWERAGFAQVRLREGVEMGSQVNTIRVMVKALGGGSIPEYLAILPRDDPASTAP
jgi:GNAT superfamily N-acetyltransferase